MAETAPASSGSPFWRFSLRLYRLPGVAEACIKLQEESGADVNLLLFLLWHGVQQRRVSADEVARLDQKIAAWRAGGHSATGDQARAEIACAESASGAGRGRNR